MRAHDRAQTSHTMAEARLGVIGAGNMATALVRGLIAAGSVAPTSVWVSSPSGPRRAIADTGVHCTTDNAVVARNADVLILAVKPYVLSSALASVAAALKPTTLVVSVAAGISIGQITGMLGVGGGWRVIRVMPNTPAAIGQGASAMCLGSLATEDDAQLAQALFSAIGTVETVGEAMMDGAAVSRGTRGARTRVTHSARLPSLTPLRHSSPPRRSCDGPLWVRPRVCVHVYRGAG